MENWLRAYELKVEDESSAWKIGNIGSTPHSLRVEFEVEKTTEKNSNSTNIKVYNLNPDHIKFLESKKCKVQLRAGYGRDGSACKLIFAGNVTSTTTTRDNGNVCTEIEAYDGYDSITNVDFNLSYKSTIDSKKIYEQIASNMGAAIEFADDLKFKQFPSGFAFVGKPKAGLEKVAVFNGHKWTIQNEIVQVTNPNSPIKNEAFVLAKDTGMIDVPKQYTEGEDKSKETGWEVNCFMNPGINVGSIVKIESKELNGEFLVKKLSHSGCNLDGDWLTKLKVINRG